MTKAAIRAEFGVERVSVKRIIKVQQTLEAEVELYDLFLTGQVYAYAVTDKDGACVDSCCGFFTEDIDKVVQQGRDFVDSL